MLFQMCKEVCTTHHELDVMSQDLLICRMATGTVLGLITNAQYSANTKNTDSFVIAVDNCCSYSMTNSKTDFVGESSIRSVGQ